MSLSTTLRVNVRQRDLLRRLAEDRNSTMIETLDAALDALRRQDFFAAMQRAEDELRADPAAWTAHRAEACSWQDVP